MPRRRRIEPRSRRRLGRKLGTTVRISDLGLTPAVDLGQLSKLAAIVVLALLGWAVYSIFNLSAFFVYADSTQVRGNFVVTPEEIYAVSGLEGMSIFWVNPDVVAQRVTVLPNIKSASVRVRLPGRVIISVQERAPSMVWLTGDSRWWVDAEGAFVEQRRNLPDVLIVVDVDGKPVQNGEKVDISTLASIRALHLLKPDLDVMYVSDSTGISFKTPEGWPVYLGDDRDMETKVDAFERMHSTLLAQGVTPQFIDIQYAASPYFR